MTAARKLMDNDEFLRWCETQEDSYELVDGVPVLKYWNGPEMRAGGNARHADVIGNIYAALRTKLRGRPCRPYIGDHLAVRTEIRKERRPDVFVDCTGAEPTDLNSTTPTVLFEVLSPSSGGDDLIRKPAEYKRLATARHYVVIDPATPLAKVWSRGDDGVWSEGEVEGIEGAVELPAIGTALTMAEIYENVRLDSPRPAAF
jgi:Uma2 family endonuclease